jgi:hypothetical protein
MPRAKKATVVIDAPSVPNQHRTDLSFLVPTAIEGEVNETFEKLGDNLNNALAKAEEELKRIDERAEYAISIVSQAIRTRAAVEKGRVLLSIKEKFNTLPEFDGKFHEWMKLAGVSISHAQKWMNAARVVDDATPIFGENLVMNMGVSTLDGLHRLPTEAKVEVLCTAEETGKAPTEKEVRAIAQKPETKLTKAQELLAEARAKRDEKRELVEEVKADPEINYKDPEYSKAFVEASKAEARVVELEGQVEEFRLLVRTEKAKAEAEAKARASAEAELESLKFDDEAARQQRIKRIQSTLTVQIPQVVSDIQKYRAERDHYDEEYRIALDTLIKDLQSYLSEYSV